MYANILALKKESSSLIRQLHESSMIPVITKKADFDTILSAYPAIDTELARTMWQYDLRATELYNCIYYNHYGITLPNDYTRNSRFYNTSTFIHFIMEDMGVFLCYFV